MKVKVLLGRHNPTLLTLLQCGCRVTLPDGRYLQGDPETGYIHIGSEASGLGLYSLDRNGLSQALRDRDFRDCVPDEDTP